MTVQKRCNVTLADVQAELAEVEATYRERKRRLKALIRVIEAESFRPEADDDGEEAPA